MVARDGRVSEFSADSLQRSQGAHLVHTHEAAIAGRRLPGSRLTVSQHAPLPRRCSDRGDVATLSRSWWRGKGPCGFAAASNISPLGAAQCRADHRKRAALQAARLGHCFLATWSKLVLPWRWRNGCGGLAARARAGAI
jgi:hypothetical protein